MVRSPREVDNCQIGVLAALGKGHLSTLIDERLYRPKECASNPARCHKAGIPEADRIHKSKSELALEMVRHQRTLGLRFAWVGADGGYGKEPAFLRGLEAMWDGIDAQAHQWHLMVRREIDSPETIRYTVSNAPAAISAQRLAQMQAQRFWIERSLQDGKSESGLADYQARKWRSWHHHMALVFVAMLFILDGWILQNDNLPLLSCSDIESLLHLLTTPGCGAA